jgi:hypothetical protein
MHLFEYGAIFIPNSLFKEVVKEAASMQSTDMVMVKKLESAININERHSQWIHQKSIKYRDNI